MTRVHDFEHGPFQVVCIASPQGTRWASAAMLMHLDSLNFDDRPRWFAWNFQCPEDALKHAEVSARDMIDSGAIGFELIDRAPARSVEALAAA